MVVELDVGVDPRSGEAGAVEFPRTERNYHRLRRVRVRVGNGDNCGFAK